MDGVIVDSVSCKRERWSRVLDEEFGIEDVDAAELVGLNASDKYDYLVETAGLGIDEDEFLDVFNRGVERVYTEQVTLLPHFESTVEWLADRDVQVGLASASSRDKVELVVDRFGLATALDAVVSADDVDEPSKPDPAIYHRAASIVGVEPTACVAVEDSTHGVAAAKAAGMYCLGYAPPHHPPQDLTRADEIVSSPEELGDRIKASVDTQ